MAIPCPRIQEKDEAALIDFSCRIIVTYVSTQFDLTNADKTMTFATY